MLEIILTILKVIGVGIGVIAAAVLILLLMALLIPIRYEIDGENEESENLKIKGNIHWLFHIVSFQVSYENEEMKRVLRIFGVPVWKK